MAYTRSYAIDQASLAAIPFDRATGLRAQTLTEVSSSISLEPGAYVALLDGAVDAVLRLGSAAAAPTPGAAETAGAWIQPARGATSFVVEGDADGRSTASCSRPGRRPST